MVPLLGLLGRVRARDDELRDYSGFYPDPCLNCEYNNWVPRHLIHCQVVAVVAFSLVLEAVVKVNQVNLQTDYDEAVCGATRGDLVVILQRDRLK